MSVGFYENLLKNRSNSQREEASDFNTKCLKISKLNDLNSRNSGHPFSGKQSPLKTNRSEKP